jgi:hypothetical protein
MDKLKSLYKDHQKDNINLTFFYVDENNEVYSIKNKLELVENGIITRERQLYIIKENQFNILHKHKLISLSYFNVDISKNSVEELINNKINNNFYTKLEIVDTIELNPSLIIFNKLNSIYYIYKVITNSNNTTKKIILNKKNRKTRNHKIDIQKDLKHK